MMSGGGSQTMFDVDEGGDSRLIDECEGFKAGGLLRTSTST
jgi:hypothetical protein